MILSGLTFLAPLTLIGLLALPMIWWLLRVTPPLPKDTDFPPLRILRDVLTEEETPNSTPFWLLLFRLLMVTLIVLALARPIIQKAQGVEDRPLVLVVENGWAAAANWGDIIKEAEARISDARRKNLEVLFVTTAETRTDIKFEPADIAMKHIKALTPHPYAPNLMQTAQILKGLDISEGNSVWLSSGVEYLETNPIADVLKSTKSVERLIPNSETLPLIPARVEETANGLRAVWYRLEKSSLRSSEVSLNGRDGRTIARQDISFAPNEISASVEFELPSELRNRIASVRSGGTLSAGSIHLLDDRWGRPLIGILSEGDSGASPLLSENFYAETALKPYADIFEGPLKDLLPLAPTVLIMPDNARDDSEALIEFVETGGLLIRFAGPKLAKRNDSLLPVDLREGGRDLGGALTWEKPQSLDPFTEDSPFYGLTISDDIRVTRQIMANPGTETDSRTWARLADGSPIVTSSPRGLGRIVLFHVTAGPEWSNLAVSGLYVDMLRRLLPLAKSEPRETLETSGNWVAERVLNGFGRLEPPSPEISQIKNDAFDTITPSAKTPPGLYRQGTRRKALNTITDPETFGITSPISGIKDSRYGQTVERSLSGILLALALMALTLDAFIALFVSGRLSNLSPSKLLSRRSIAPVIAFSFVIIAMLPTKSWAQETRLQTEQANALDTTPDAALGLYLAYIKTGDSRKDRMSEAAMSGIVQALTNRTTIEPEGVKGVNLERDTLVFYPFLYFPVSRDAPELSAPARAALNAYMTNGGTVVFDTQDQGDKIITGGMQHPGLSRVTEGLDLPEIGQVPKNHVLTKSFYLLQVFPGRWANGPVWVARNQSGSTQDGVSRVIIGSNDWAAAWATSEDGDPLATLENDILKQREMALRFGVNLTMYALAGNYKADQVHAAALVERLGQDKKSPENLGPRKPN